CHGPVADGQSECPSCGIVVSKFHSAPRRTGAGHAPTPALKTPPTTQAGALSRILVVLALSIAGGVAVIGGYWFFKIRPRVRAIEDPYYGSDAGRAKKLKEITPSRAEFDFALQLPGRPQGAASDGRQMIIANGSEPWGGLRIALDGGRYTSQTVPVIETGNGQKIGFNTITWNGQNYVGYTTGAWFGKQQDVFAILDPTTLRVTATHPAPPLLGGLAWDGSHYWASTRKNTPAAGEEAFFYKIDRDFQVVAKSKPPGIGCQGLAWDGRHLWYVDVFSDSIEVLDISSDEPRVIHEANAPMNYLSGVVFHQNAIWVVDYDSNRLQRLRNSTRLAWAGYAAPEVAAASIIPAPAADRRVSAKYENSFLERGPAEAQEIEWTVDLRDDGVWLTSSRVWFGPDLFVSHEQTSTIVTIPVFAHYTFTVQKPDGSKVEKQFDGTSGENVLSYVKLADYAGAGEYEVSLFIHVQYIDANGTAKILNNQGGFAGLRN
ncbi:MAG: hypothetical protein ACXW2Q_10170, partial [Thermoanaerobaculia bacterium]